VINLVNFNYNVTFSQPTLSALAHNMPTLATERAPVCSIGSQTNSATSRRRLRYLILFGHIDGTELAMQASASRVILTT